MPEDNKIQPGFQTENQVDLQVQQNNFIQEQHVQGNSQQISQQNNVTCTQQNIQQNTQQNTEKKIQTIYYHPSRLTKILSGVYRFIGIVLIRSGLRNFSLIGTDDLSFLKILYVGGVIILCGIGHVLFGRLLYCTKKRIHLGPSLICAVVMSVFLAWILNKFGDSYFDYLIMVFSIGIYFIISTIAWLIKCFKLKKWGKASKKAIDPTPGKKKVGIITTLALLLIVIINLLFGKFQYSRIPKVDESIFYRTEHQTPMSPEKDALVQLRLYLESLWSSNEIFSTLDGICIEEINNKEIWWDTHSDECMIIYSGGDTYCGTRVRNRKTLYRLLNHYPLLHLKNGEEYLTLNGNKITVMEYLDKNESSLRNKLLELDHILSLDYYVPKDGYMGVFPPSTQSFARASEILLQYYTRKKDWDMVLLIIKINYKIIDIANHIGGALNNLISIVLQGIINDVINSSVKIYPQDVRMKIIDLLPKQTELRNNMVQETAKGEYVILKESKKEDMVASYLKDNPSMQQFLFHRPFYSEKDYERAMLYMYNMILNNQFNDFYNFNEKMLSKPLPIYNYCVKKYGILTPRLDSFEKRLNYNIVQINTLITNLKAGEFKEQFNEAYKEIGDNQFDNYRLILDDESV